MEAKGVLAALAGATVGMYAGLHALVPLAFAGVIWYAGNKLAKPRDLAYLPAIAVQGGHMMWLALGLFLLGALNASVLDLLVLGVGVTWLWFRPTMWPVVLLTAFQVMALAFNLFTLLSEAVGSSMHKGLVVHVALRVAALVYMWRAYLRGRPPAADAVTSNP